MSYVSEILQPSEKILSIGKLHWMIYLPAIMWMIVGVITVSVLGLVSGLLALIVSGVICFIAVVLAVKEWIHQWVTEIAITDRRVIYKTGLIRRRTAEMNMKQIESVDVDQSVVGRLLNYGSVYIRGTGEGLEHLHYISSPLSLRNAITAQ